jgi:hypothetical protein
VANSVRFSNSTEHASTLRGGTTTGYERPDSKIPPLTELQSYVNTLQQILALYREPYPDTIATTGIVGFAPDQCNATSFEYDPDLSGIFFIDNMPGVEVTPAQAAQEAVDNRAGIIVGGVLGSIAGVAIIALVVTIIVNPSFRDKVFPFLGARDAAKTPAPIDEEDSGTDLKKRKKNWTRGSTPAT